MVQWGQGGTGFTGGEESRWRIEITCGGAPGKSRRRCGPGSGSELGELPGPEAELLCGSGGAGVRRSGVAAAERGALLRRQDGAWTLG